MCEERKIQNLLQQCCPLKNEKAYRTLLFRFFDFHQGVTKRCRLSWLTNSALKYEAKWSNSIFNLWFPSLKNPGISQNSNANPFIVRCVTSQYKTTITIENSEKFRHRFTIQYLSPIGFSFHKKRAETHQVKHTEKTLKGHRPPHRPYSFQKTKVTMRQEGGRSCDPPWSQSEEPARQNWRSFPSW